MSLTFTGSTLPTWTSALAAPTATGGSGDGSGGDDDGDALQRWSSLIGIITAIVGNVLIALALNVQRYAHTRLHKERKRRKQGARAALKRAQSSNSSNGSTQVGVYGTIIGDGAGDRDRNNSNGYQNGDGNGFSIPNYDEPSEDEHEYLEDEPLMASFQSSVTTASTDTDAEPKGSSSNYLKSPYWWLGQILITLGEAGNFLAYGFAPASIVSPLGVVALVSNCIIAPAMFHEKFRLRDFWGVVIAVSGVVTVVLSANQEETKLNPHDVWGAITTMAFEIYLGVTTFLIIVLMWASAKYGKRTILIDLGLVGLFGGFYTVILIAVLRLTFFSRRIYGFSHQGRVVNALYKLRCGLYNSRHICAHIYPLIDCRYADSLCQQSAVPLRLDPGHPHPVRHVHTVCHHWQCCSISRL